MSSARNDVALCLEAYKRSNTYGNALALQKAQRKFDDIVAENRSSLVGINGDEGISFRSEEQVTTSALKRIIVEIENTPDKYDRALLYIHRLAKQALVEAGRG